MIISRFDWINFHNQTASTSLIIYKAITGLPGNYWTRLGCGTGNKQLRLGMYTLFHSTGILIAIQIRVPDFPRVVQVSRDFPLCASVVYIIYMTNLNKFASKQ